MKGSCESCHEDRYLFALGGRHLCVNCFTDRSRRMRASYRGRERRVPGAPNSERWARRWDDRLET